MVSGSPKPSWKRLAWFVAIYVLSLAAVLALAYGIRFWLGLG